ncbi:MAG: DnaJ domain-containing protein [Kordiimonadaceae bacterium]|nr:DnaJ domain-containing protein [Kordiimonadaceae bacterium]MBO6569998.1 DnaJ domain-containing protein [Kordiimonadaceae bacterium]MBO6965905.1 DnaJ domain-containing protein [Kordiimonadaceae bacterium]
MRNLYSILGVEQKASEADIKKAYRSLAKELHPDLNKNDQRIADRFKEVSAAYSILGDKSQRGKYDRGEIDENGNEKAPNFGGGFGRGGFGNRQREFDMDDAESVFSEFFRFTGAGKTSRGTRGRRANGNRTQQAPKSKGLDISYEVTVGFEESINGGTRRLSLNDGRSVDIKVPAGIKNGQVIRLSGQGGPGLGKGPSGDALVEVRVATHPYFKRDGNDIHLDLPISIDEAILGGDIQVPTPRGKLTVRIPRNSSSGTRLRLKGKGVETKSATGNMYVALKIMAPPKRDTKLEKAIKEWGGQDGDSLRKKAGLS